MQACRSIHDWTVLQLKVSEHMLISKSPEDVMRNSWLEANSTFIPGMDELRKQDSRLYFECDGHFNAKGVTYSQNYLPLVEKTNRTSSILNQ